MAAPPPGPAPAAAREPERQKCERCPKIRKTGKRFCAGCYRKDPSLKEAENAAWEALGESRLPLQHKSTALWEAHVADRVASGRAAGFSGDELEDAPQGEVDRLRAVLRDLRDSRTPLVDLRSQGDFEAQRVQGNLAVLNIPWPSFPQRAFELPPRSVPLATLAYDDAAVSESHLACLACVRSERNKWEREPWTVAHALRASPALFRAAALEGLLAAGPAPPERQARLWRPCELVARVAPLLRGLPGPFHAVDLGCGPGRDSIFLARVLRGIEPGDAGTFAGSEGPAGPAGEGVVHGLDYLPASRPKFEGLAARCGVAGAAVWQHADLKREAGEVREMLGALGPGPLMLALGVRFNHRPLFGVLRDAVAPGGVVAWAQFQRPEGGEWGWKHPSKTRDILEPGEMAATFEGWEVLFDEVSLLSDGRPLNFFAARRPRG